MFENQLNKLRTLQPLLQAVNQETITAQAKFLYDRISNPDSYLVFLGETSSGKTSMINGLLDDHVLPVKATPSTATITEVELCNDIPKDEYYAINKDATLEDLTLSQFQELCLKPTETLARLKIRHKISDSSKGLANLRIFDTPGYGSIIKEHEEVLKEFLPNSDVIVYTVSYGAGIKESDYTFLRFLRELVRDDVKFLLLINMCPPDADTGDVKVQEILQYVNSLLHLDSDVILQPRLKSPDGINRPLVHSKILWKSVNQVINNPKRVEFMRQVFDSYIIDLYNLCDDIVQKRYFTAKLDNETYHEYVNAQRETGRNIRGAIDKFVRPTFKGIRERLPVKMTEAQDKIVSTLHAEIEKTNSMQREDTRSYFNAFFIPHTIECVWKDNVSFYIQTEIEDLNKKVDDYIQQEIINLETKIKKIETSNVELQGKNLMGSLVQRVGTNNLGRYFAKFGGAGGANAGIANAASHCLKKIGNLFNKKFSRETHNALKHYMSKFGATSMKAVGFALVVLFELGFAIWDVSTFKLKFKKNSSKAIEKWKSQTLPLALKDLDQLEEVNIATLREIAHGFENDLSDNPQSLDIETCYEHVLISQQVRKNIMMK